MSATTILVVLGGLTSSSDARAHHWVAWRAFLAQALVVMVTFSVIHAARDQQQKI
jgi:hypothetical protein